MTRTRTILMGLLACLLACAPALATLPATGYATATATNPSAAVTGTALLVDLSKMSTDWWNSVDTADFTKGRASNSDGSTEYACDWIAPVDNDDGTGSGYLRFGPVSLSDTGTQTFRIYPPVSGNDSVAAGATYGQYAVYANDVAAYYPLMEGSGTSAANRTSASGAGTLDAGMTWTAGGGVTADGQSNAVIDLPDTFKPLDAATTFTIIARVNADDIATDRGIFYTDGHVGSEPLLFWLDNAVTDHVAVLLNSDTGTGALYAGAAASASTEYHLVLTVDTVAGVVLYIDGASDTTGSFPAPPVEGGLQATDSHYRIGQDATGNKAFDGVIGYIALLTRAMPAAEVALEYDQTDDNATFWNLGAGDWTWNAAAGGSSIPPIMHHYRMRRSQ